MNRLEPHWLLAGTRLAPRLPASGEAVGKQAAHERQMSSACARRDGVRGRLCMLEAQRERRALLSGRNPGPHADKIRTKKRRSRTTNETTTRTAKAGARAKDATHASLS